MFSLFRLAILTSITTSILALPSSHSEHGSDNKVAKKNEVGSVLRKGLHSPSIHGVPIVHRRQNTTSSTELPLATVEVCTGTQASGQCYNATWPVNACISLRGYAGNIQSFIPSIGSSCLLTQGRCDVTLPYADFDASDFVQNNTEAVKALDLGKYYPWVGNASSYMCFTEFSALKRFVRVQRLRVAGAVKLV